jgi:magnesium transporter
MMMDESWCIGYASGCTKKQRGMCLPMLRTLLVTNDLEVIQDIPLDHLNSADVKWYWVDFDNPTEEERNLLRTHFDFHPLAVEDCFQNLQRPKVDYYEGYNFFVVHNLNPATLEPEEVDLFVGHNFLVTVHLLPSREIDAVRERKLHKENTLLKGPIYICYLIMDKIVDYYFPSIEKIEDEVDQIEVVRPGPNFIEDLYELRNRLLDLRHIVVPMRELLYRILNSERLDIPQEERLYFRDIDDHLLKQSELIESNREVTADLRDSYVSLNTNRMNIIMTTLTIVATIFIPLTFIVGVYGMNFDYMPELRWQWGYFGIWGIMIAIAVGMLIGFKMKGWFK